MTAFLEQQIEAKAVAALTAALAGAAEVTGFLQPSLAGTQKDHASTGVLVTCKPRAGVFGQPLTTLQLIIDIKISDAVSPTGDKISELAAPVMNTIESWHASSSALRTALNVADVFRADAVVNADGGDAGFDDLLGVWFWTVNLTLKGCTL